MAGRVDGPGNMPGMPSPGNAGGFAQAGVTAPSSIPGFARPGAPIDAEHKIIGGTTGDDGVAQLVAGHVTVTASIKTGDTVNIERITASATTGSLSVSSITDGSFHIDSSSSADTSLVRWQVVRAGV